MLDVLAEESNRPVDVGEVSTTGMLAAGGSIRKGVSLLRCPIHRQFTIDHESIGCSDREVSGVGRTKDP